MARRIVVALVALALCGAAPVAEPLARPASVPVAVAAKPCSAGFAHAVIDGEHKCLRRGQFCRRAADRQYHRYGFHCHRYDPRVGRYRLT